MKLLEAFKNGTSKGKHIVSCQEREYTPVMLNAKWLGENAVVYNRGMNEAERKGKWSIST